jgi:hypothetical protein
MSPGPISPMTLPPVLTEALSTRCRRARIRDLILLPGHTGYPRQIAGFPGANQLRCGPARRFSEGVVWPGRVPC